MGGEKCQMLQPASAQSSKLLLLPPEVLEMILDYFSGVPRVVVIDQHAFFDRVSSHTQIVESCPVLLHVCRHLRNLALSRYGTVPANLERKGWGIIKHLKFQDLKTISKTLGLQPQRTVRDMYLNITKYMNSHPEEAEKFSDFGEYSAKSRPALSPGWFNPKGDILLLKNGPQSVRSGLRPGKLLMLRFDNLRNLAMELTCDDFDIDPLAGRVTQALWNFNRVWLKGGLWRTLEEAYDLTFVQSLQSLTLILPGQCEIIVITKADKLEAGRCAFRLDTGSEQFREEMGLSWANVTWRVILGHGHQPQTQMCNLLWMLPDWQQWKRAKIQLAMNDPKVGHVWKQRVSSSVTFPGTGIVLLTSTSNSQYPLPELTWKMVENGDGRIYWDISP